MAGSTARTQAVGTVSDDSRRSLLQQCSSDNVPSHPSRVHRNVLLSLSFFLSFTLFGITGGYQALFPVLVADGVYSNLCPVGNSTCTAQTLRLDLMFTVSVTSVNLAAVFVGWLSDKIGPKLMLSLSAVLVAVGAVLFAFANSVTFDAYIPSYMFLSFAGVMLYYSMAHLSNLLPGERRGLFYALVTAGFDSSAAMFYLFQVMYFQGHMSLRLIFLLFLIWPGLQFALTFLMPWRPYEAPSAPPSRDSGIQLATSDSADEHTTLNAASANETTPLNASHSAETTTNSVWRLLKDRYLWYGVAWCAVGLPAVYFYLTTVNTQIAWMINPEQATLGTVILSYMLPIGGVFVGPLNGMVLDKCGTATSLYLLAVVLLVLNIVSVIPVFWLQPVAFLAFVIARAGFFAVMMKFIYEVTAGTPHFGKAYGFVMSVGAVFNTLNYLWADLCARFNDYRVLPLIVLSVAVVGTVVLGLLVQKRDRDKLKSELTSNIQ